MSSPFARPPHGQKPPSNPPVNLPPAVIASLAVLFVVFLFQQYVIDFSGRSVLWMRFGFIAGRYSLPLDQQGLAWLWSPVTYSLLHGSWTHIIFNSIWLAIFGAPVANRIGSLRFAILWIVSAVFSAFFFAALNWGSPEILIGASGVVSAYMGAACRFVFTPRGAFSVHAHINPRLSIIQVAQNKTARAFVLVWLIGNLAVAAGFGLVGVDAADVAWQAHIGGFLFGFLAFPLFDHRTPRVLRF
ncbi:rhomboid family intramembrane serine protease [Martelella alba]|uniref:Rhomboid family intramembrane serine protease n=1 Tax=Martelella alba TaxID=2590451 RepID=A0A506U0Y3_9HYPH|nr:rhomboid family intramembrane serine protease [Martelella alba]TPW28012.1 rhomboid family intramembrane serine protease [Martelella alba]